jgi:hypothetical protein
MIALLPVRLEARAENTPAVQNRAAKPDEWGYRPADGATVRLNPPSLTWVLEPDAQTYTVAWSTTKDFARATTVADVPWPTYTHNAALPPGEYFWRYRFVNKKGQASAWSAVRRFTVPADAAAFPMPTRAEQKERVPKAHPRLFMRPEDLPKLRELARGREAKAFAKLRAEADRIIAAGPTPEPTHMGSARDKENPELVKYWWPNREQTEKACKEAETIAFVYLISGEKKYGEAARRWIMHLASWNPDGPTNFKLNCEAGKPLLFRPSRAYDWAYDALSEADRAAFRRIMLRRITDAWESGEVQRGVGHLNRPYNSHGNRVWHKIGESGIALLGELPEAETWLDYAVNKFYACYPTWSDDDGGWHEGVSYWGGYMSKAVWWLQVAKPALGIDGFQKPFFSQVGDYPLYIAPPGSPNMGFGDLSFRPPSAGWGGFMEFFLRADGGGKGDSPHLPERPATNVPSVPGCAQMGTVPFSPSGPTASHAGYWRWWTDEWKMKGEGGVLGFLYAANLPPLPAARPPTDLPQSKIFHGIGVASLHTTLLNAADDVHFLFKSSPFGSQSHGHNPQNSFQLNAYGEPLLMTCVYRDLHGSKFHYQWAHSTVAHNAVLVNGEGQVKHVASPQGRIADEQLGDGFDYAAGDATAAYGGRLVRAMRHVAFVKGQSPVLVLYDDLEAAEPSTFQFMLHALQEFKVDEKATTLATERAKAGVLVQYLPGRTGTGSEPALSFRQWDGYDPKPNKEFPNQWHVEAGTRDKQRRVEVLTVLLPYRAGKPPALKAERIDSPGAIGVRLTLDGRPIEVAFRRADAIGDVSWNGRKFDGAVLVK